ncbi:MAG: ATP synthase F1 subunit delta, partial [Deltaproteobacteria bacterium]|nr:ATP synthase F1 subunit delta [Deltaproteobacteria bacterium]
MSAVARRYARAVVDAAAERAGAGAIDALTEEMQSLAGAFAGSAELREALLNPSLKAEQARVIDAVAGKLGLAQEALSLVRVLVEASRVNLLPEVAAEVQAVADERAGRLRAHVSAPLALSEAQSKRIGKALERRFGKAVVVSTSVDASLLGGLVCQVGDLTLDASLRR